MADCIFCKIATSEIQAYKIYENDHFIVILDRFPACTGHTLVIPKRHIENIYELSDDLAEEAFALTARLARAIKDTFGTEIDGLNVLQNNGKSAGQSVMHFHIHLIPRKNGDDISINWKQTDPRNDVFADFTKRIADFI